MQGPLPVSLGRLASPKGVTGHPRVGQQKSTTLEAGEAWRVLLGEVASKSAFLGFHSFTKTLPTELGYQQVEGIRMVSVGPSPHPAGHLINVPTSLRHGQAFTAARFGDGLGTSLLSVNSPHFKCQKCWHKEGTWVPI